VTYDSNSIYVFLQRILVHHFHTIESSVGYGYEGRAATIGRAHKHRIVQFPMNVSERNYCLNIQLSVYFVFAVHLTDVSFVQIQVIVETVAPVIKMKYPQCVRYDSTEYISNT
jgi:hypothetical protein